MIFPSSLLRTEGFFLSVRTVLLLLLLLQLCFLSVLFLHPAHHHLSLHSSLSTLPPPHFFPLKKVFFCFFSPNPIFPSSSSPQTLNSSQPAPVPSKTPFGSSLFSPPPSKEASLSLSRHSTRNTISCEREKVEVNLLHHNSATFGLPCSTRKVRPPSPSIPSLLSLLPNGPWFPLSLPVHVGLDVHRTMYWLLAYLLRSSKDICFPCLLASVILTLATKEHSEPLLD